MGNGGNGSLGPAVPALGQVLGPPTIPLDQLVSMLSEVEAAHRILDALGLPPGTIAERMTAHARDWLRRVGDASQTHIAIESRRVIRAAGAPLWTPPDLDESEP